MGMSHINWKLIQRNRMFDRNASVVILMSFSSFDGLTPVQKSERMQAMEDRIRSALASWAAGHYHDKQHEDVIKSWLHSFAELPGGKRRLLRMKAWMYIVTSKEQTEALWPADI